jgi:hypothetical protein
MSNQNVEVTKRGYDAFGAGDLEAAGCLRRLHRVDGERREHDRWYAPR